MHWRTPHTALMPVQSRRTDAMGPLMRSALMELRHWFSLAATVCMCAAAAVVLALVWGEQLDNVGATGRVLTSLSAVGTALLSVDGVAMWLRRQRTRRRTRRIEAAAVRTWREHHRQG